MIREESWNIEKYKLLSPLERWILQAVRWWMCILLPFINFGILILCAHVTPNALWIYPCALVLLLIVFLFIISRYDGLVLILYKCECGEKINFIGTSAEFHGDTYCHYKCLCVKTFVV